MTTITPAHNNPRNVTVTLTTDNDRVTRQDAAFYVGYANPVAIVTDDAGHSITVRCVGEMCLNVWQPGDPNGVNPEYIRDAEGLIAAGVVDDMALLDAEERIEWINNAWFELFDSNDDFDDLGDVFHDLDDAIGAAFETLNDPVLNPRG